VRRRDQHKHHKVFCAKSERPKEVRGGGVYILKDFFLKKKAGTDRPKLSVLQ